MRSYWWQLPGPAGFIQRIIQGLEDGKNIILSMPEYSVKEPGGILRAELGNNPKFNFFKLDAGDISYKDQKPVRILFSKFIPHTDQIPNINTLMESDEFSDGKIIYIENLDRESWPHWKEFLNIYGCICRSIPELYRTVFCILLKGNLALDPPKEDICIVQYKWKNIISYFDMLLYVLHNFQYNKKIAGIQRKLAISTIAHIALWDPEVAEKLSQEDMSVIFNPVTTLKDIAIERQWDKEENNGDLWRRGIEDSMDGEEKIHSAILAINDPHKELERRIWNAQIGIMFPYIEERRRKFLEKFSNLLEVPFLTRFNEIIEDYRDLEIGHIECQILKNNLPLKTEVKDHISILREIRNNLSHLEPVHIDFLIDKHGLLNVKI